MPGAPNHWCGHQNVASFLFNAVQLLHAYQWTTVLNPDSVGHIRLPGTVYAALSSLLIKRLIVCVTDVVLL